MRSAPCLTAARMPVALGIAAVCHGDIAWRQGAMLERFAGVDIADQHLDKLQGHQVHRDMEAMVGACGSWGLNTAGVDDHKAPPRRQRGSRGQGQHPPEHRLHPRPTARKRSATAWSVMDSYRAVKVPATSRKGLSKPQYKKTTRKSCAGVLTFLARTKALNSRAICAVSGGRSCKSSSQERLWICQGQLHGMLLLWTGGANVSSMQYALIFYDLQLILAPMGQGGHGAGGFGWMGWVTSDARDTHHTVVEVEKRLKLRIRQRPAVRYPSSVRTRKSEDSKRGKSRSSKSYCLLRRCTSTGRWAMPCR